MQLAAIALISAAILAYEVLLARLFSIIQWYHFAYMVISIALLGYGASGTFVALVQGRLTSWARPAFALFAALFGVSAVGCFALAERLPFNALEIVWDPHQLILLTGLYALLTVPFFWGAACIGLAFACFDVPVGRIYRADLLGAGTGALGIVLALFVLAPSQALQAVGALAMLAAALASLSEGRQGYARAIGFAIAAPVMALALPAAWTELQLSPYKGLRQALEVPGAVIEAERSSPLGLLSAVRSPEIPFRHVPGLSLNNVIEPPPQIGVFTNGDGLSPITAFDGRTEPLAYLDLTTSALPYHLLKRPEVLILGAGGGAEVLSAIWHDSARVDAVELNAQLVDLVRDTYADFAGRLYERPEVEVHVAEARGFVAGTDRRYDLIELPLLESFAASAGTASLNESFVYTVEALDTFLDHLKPGGYLAITRWLKLPPRDSLKLFLSALVALKARAVSEPWRQLALIRGWDTTTLLVKNGALGQRDVERIRSFVQERSFDPVYYPGMPASEANQSNILERPYFYEGAQALLGPERDRFVARYKFDLTPATDDRPYFFDFFRWRALPEIAALAAQSGPALLDWGYLILFATLVQAAFLSLLLVLLPLWLWSPCRLRAAEQWRIGLYFSLIGLAFLFVEIASIQRFTLFLSHPLYAIAVVLAGFLVFAGLGSGAAAGLDRRLRDRSAPGALELAVAAIAILSIAYVFGLPMLFRGLMALPDVAKIALSLVLVAPLAFFMGMPFPLVLARVRTHAPDFVPWAWAINGCASVMSAIAATLLTMGFGARAVVLTAAALYLLAALVARRPGADSEQSGAVGR
jgi:spermidine synthase